MTFRLDEVLAPAFKEAGADYEEIAELTGADDEDLLRLFTSKHERKFEGEITFRGHLFRYKGEVLSKNQDYCEGKCQSSVELKLVDEDTQDAYVLTVEEYNGDFEDFSISYKGKVPASGKKSCCANPCLLTLKASGIEHLKVTSQFHTYENEIPSHLISNFGNNPKELVFNYCCNCRRVSAADESKEIQ